MSPVVLTTAASYLADYGDVIHFVQALLPQDVPWDGAKIRELPELKDFLTANRLHGGDRGMKVITTMMLKAMSTGDV